MTSRRPSLRKPVALLGGAAAAAVVAAGIAFAVYDGGSGPDSGTNNVDCADLTYADAQQMLRENASDPNHLDGNGDGEACDSNR